MSEFLWAPWRIDYITGPKPSECIFCTAASNQTEDRKNLVLMRNDHAFIIMNLYPYNCGHLMAAPLRHISDLTSLNDVEMCALWEAVRAGIEALSQAMQPHGFNVGINIGKVAGAGFQDHLHVHIVPRWTGDVNFMPITTDIRVMPELLHQTFDRLKPFFTPEK